MRSKSPKRILKRNVKDLYFSSLPVWKNVDEDLERQTHSASMSSWAQVLSASFRGDRTSEVSVQGFLGGNHEKSLERCWSALKDRLGSMTLIQLGHWTSAREEAPFFLVGSNPYRGMLPSNLKQRKFASAIGLQDHEIVLQLVHGDRDEVLKDPIFTSFKVSKTVWTQTPQKNIDESLQDHESPLLCLNETSLREVLSKESPSMPDSESPTKELNVQAGQTTIFSRRLSKVPQVWSVHIVVPRNRQMPKEGLLSNAFQRNVCLFTREQPYLPKCKMPESCKLSDKLIELLDGPVIDLTLPKKNKKKTDEIGPKKTDEVGPEAQSKKFEEVASKTLLKKIEIETPHDKLVAKLRKILFDPMQKPTFAEDSLE